MVRKRWTGGFTISELLMVFLAVFLVGALLLPLIQYNKKKMDRITCSNNLREMGLALYIYAREHDGKFPESLETLYDEQYLSDRKIMDCPASRNAGTPGEPDYLYTPGLTVRDRSDIVLVRDRKGNHTGYGENIIYVNGAVSRSGR